MTGDAAYPPPVLADDDRSGRPVADRRMLEALVCPLTHAVLQFDADRNELISRPARLAFPVRDGIPILLIEEARRVD